MTKKLWRQEILAQLKAHDPLAKRKADQWLLEQFIALKDYKEAKTIATYLSFEFEYDTSLIIHQAHQDGKRILVPKVMSKGEMIFVPYDENDLSLSSFGLKEPNSNQAILKTDIDLIHVPGLIFNSKGYRIGYGGGFYDRYLKDYEGLTLATIYQQQLKEFDPETHDIAVRKVLIDETNA
ncbi:5-formyltetrahydrofolate cyclo-ligase [Streptococcus pacificus]|uniref:5-formyltetrahydrofolate cyclo-ligase n=1 Tax=Streptococcus pacificus TaxID=2740577 RepID=A0ABS0ZIY4_9STRE|nr:5-formyltetrahydrofolate cyclo-ligase [Streptococcus pacificus]MBJ8325813.1 5-formyltetrahydrofolate cyclo-ligase [Streptococcus pacificus]